MTSYETSWLPHAGITSEAGWLGTDEDAVFCWLHRPASGLARGAVVCCPPLLSEYDAAYLTFRELGDTLAGAGLAALRLDWPGTGNSTGDQTEFTSLDPWLDSVTRCVDALRAAGAPMVSVLGMRAAANLVAAASARCGADAVILWDPAPSGRAFVRHSTLLQRTVVELKANQGDAPGGPLPASPLTSLAPGETGPAASETPSLGYDYRKEFVEALRGLQLTSLAEVPTLLVTRGGRLPPALQNRSGVEVLEALGQEALLETYLDLAETPHTSMLAIVRWALDRAPREAPILRSPLRPAVHPIAGVAEHTARFGPTGLFGVVTGPAERCVPAGAVPTCLILNSGLVPNPGPHRFSAELARRLAVFGVRVIRADLSGIGDSPTRPGRPQRVVYSPVAIEDIKELIDAISSERLFVTGVCSGGYHALEAAAVRRPAGVLAVHAWLDIWNINNRTDSAGGDREVWVSDRPWLRRINGTRVGGSVLWRLPSWGWKLLDRIGLQDDLSTGLRKVLERGVQVTMLVEDDMLERPRSVGLKEIDSPSLTLIRSQADHSLFDERGRSETADVVAGAILAGLGILPNEPASV